MSLAKILTPLVSLAVLSGCSSVPIQPVLSSKVVADPKVGYIAGTFTRAGGGHGFAYMLRNAETGTEYAMPLGEPSGPPKGLSDQVVAIKVPPGRYSVASWVTYATLDHTLAHKGTIKNTYLTEPFDVAAGSVVFLGKFATSTTVTPEVGRVMTYWSIKPQSVSTAAAKERFLLAYPTLDGRSFSCRICADMLPAPKQEQFAPLPP